MKRARSRGVIIRRVRSPLLSQVHERESLPTSITYNSRRQESKVPQLFSSVRSAMDQRLLLSQRPLREPPSFPTSMIFAASRQFFTSYLANVKIAHRFVLVQINPKYLAASNPDTNSIVKSVNFRWSNILSARRSITRRGASIYMLAILLFKTAGDVIFDVLQIRSLHAMPRLSHGSSVVH